MSGEQAAVNGVKPDRYTEGDVNHVLQPVIGILRLHQSDPDRWPLGGEAIGGAIDRMLQACASERQWLAARAVQPTPPAQAEAVAADWCETTQKFTAADQVAAMRNHADHAARQVADVEGRREA